MESPESISNGESTSSSQKSFNINQLRQRTLIYIFKEILHLSMEIVVNLHGLVMRNSLYIDFYYFKLILWSQTRVFM